VNREQDQLVTSHNFVGISPARQTFFTREVQRTEVVITTTAVRCIVFTIVATDGQVLWIESAAELDAFDSATADSKVINSHFRASYQSKVT
jgi:hypothetical protein